jgi:CheY-like chemotaxis protein
MDHMMPEMDGVEATAAIRALAGDRAYFGTVPIIALTANAVVGMRETFLRNGFSDYLSKPIEIVKLNEIMGKWIPREKREKAEAAPKQEDAGPLVRLEIEGLDTARGIAMTGGKTSTYMEVLALFCKDAAGRLEILDEALDAQESQDVPDETKQARLVSQFHALKSALASIGAAELSKEAAFLEDAGERGDPALTGERIEHFRAALAGRIERIRAALPHERSENHREDPPPLDRALLLRLKQALEIEDIGAADRILGELTGRQADKTAGNMISDVADRVLMYDFVDAAQIIAKWLENVG